MPRRSTGPVRSIRTRSGVVGGREGAVRANGYLRGADDLRAALTRLEDRVLGSSFFALTQATQAGAEVLANAWEEQVRARIGVGPGVAHYAEAIEASSKPGRVGATGLVSLKDMAVSEGEAHPREYASRFEFGSTKRSLGQFQAGITHAGRSRVATPTLRPAFDANNGRMLDAMADTLRAFIEKAT